MRRRWDCAGDDDGVRVVWEGGVETFPVVVVVEVWMDRRDGLVTRFCLCRCRRSGDGVWWGGVRLVGVCSMLDLVALNMCREEGSIFMLVFFLCGDLWIFLRWFYFLGFAVFRRGLWF